ncbi:IPT/TIG domain-containing protein, partial [bacterium]|nr:IPT/TIG domain-containing protein [bacterium]
MDKRILSSLITAILIAAVLSVPQAQAGTVTVYLNGNTVCEAQVGDTVVVSGTNPTPGGLVKVYWKNMAPENKLNETRSIALGYGYGYGQYECTIKVPEAAYGSYAIIVLDEQSGETGVATLKVKPKITPSPTTVLPGDTITVKGTGFTAGANVSKVIIDLGKASETDVTPSETVNINASGSFLCAFEVPSDLGYGDHTIMVNDTSGRSANATFKVWATITLSVNEGPSGTIVDIIGKGFTAKGNVTIKMGNTTCKTLETIQANTSGIFAGKFIVPTLDAGSYTVNASDDGGKWSTATFDVTGKTAIKATPAVAAPGETITINGYNFTAMKDVVVTIDFDTLTSYATANTTENGEFTATITIPEVQVGTYTITAKDSYGLSASITFKVAITTLTILPSSGPTGTRIHIVGGGFEGGKEFNATINGKLLVLEKNETEDNGAIDTYAYIPTVPAGTYTITVMDETGIKAEESFTVTATTQITVDPSSAPENYTVSIALEYFTAAGNNQNTSVSLSMYNLTADGKVDWIYKDLWSNITIQADEGYKNRYVDATGTYKGKFEVPQLDVGTYIINATDANGLTANVTFEIVKPTVIVYTGADEYLPGDRVSFFAKCVFEYEDQVINLYTPSGFKIPITDLDITTKIGNYYTGTASYILPADAETGTWTWNTTISGVTVNGSFIVTTRTTTGALEQRILKLKSDITSLSDVVDKLSDIVDKQASDISKLSSSVGTLSDAVGSLKRDVSSLSEIISKLSSMVHTQASDISKLSSSLS